MNERDYVERLAHDVAVWTHEGLISQEQEKAILARIGAGEPRLVGALRLGWLITAVSLIGALVLGGGIVLLFAANWEAMPDWFRTLAIVAGMVAAYAAGYVLTYRYDMDRIGGALLLLGVLLYEAGLFLFANIYDVPLTTQQGSFPVPYYYFLATLGALPMAYAFGSRVVLLLAIANFVVGTVFWLVARYEDSDKADATLIVVGALGVALYAIGKLHELRKASVAFGEVYIFAGALVTLSLVYFFSFDEPWQSLIEDGIEAYAAPPLVYVAIALAALLVAGQWLLGKRDEESHAETAILGSILAIAAVVATWPAWTGYTLVFNAVFFVAAAGIITHGYMRGDERYINLGLLLVAVGVLTRYVDVFWSLLTGSAFFIVGGLLLLAVAFGLERLRRKLLTSIDDNEARAIAPRTAFDAGEPS